jgi:thiopeptide-type bacteriocin biosynthesis protein
MLTDRLTSTSAMTPATARAQSRATPTAVADGVLAVLAGAPRDKIAAELGIAAAELTDATECYQQAGHTALETQAATRDWFQVHVEFPEWTAAENTMITEVGPRLQALRDAGVIGAWWFIRKAPCWRLRLNPGGEAALADLTGTAGTILDALAADGLISGWRQTVYEPETVAFGGRQAMNVAHDLFCADSTNILHYLGQQEPAFGRRELSVLLCTTLFRAAGQEWFECGDIWHRVAQLRPSSPDVPADRLAELTESLHGLLSRDARPTGTLFGVGGPLAFAAHWAAAFHNAGQALAEAAIGGTLTQGTRAILRYHVIFHWNRLGLSVTTQSLLARASAAAIFG